MYRKSKGVENNFHRRFRSCYVEKKGKKSMISRSIILRNQKETIDFVCMVERYPYSVDISEGHRTMNAKSILGMLAMGFNCVMKMDVHCPTLSTWDISVP